MTTLDFFLSLAVAAASGMVIGFERQWQNKSAGLRTNTLVAMGAALYVLLSVQLTEEQGDVTRIIGQVVTGVGFLGAGIIFKEGANVYGLTTAATVWCSSAIGCFAGAGFYMETLIATSCIITIHLILMPLNKLLNRRK
ncbi:MAG: MgtC/SapB family protein [Reichenbachiella sp.]|uniref:MgtC/SapB family protein n=1 Tax=Reichenbachiella sp. TaxID=2184521 RepID=UPI00296749C5|nr:MgtC/SapB family protein [Reichenbachiella sp.]MDW3208427.1 MgtC/SapB family protein [Reichenbachiella sp.]